MVASKYVSRNRNGSMGEEKYETEFFLSGEEEGKAQNNPAGTVVADELLPIRMACAYCGELDMVTYPVITYEWFRIGVGLALFFFLFFVFEGFFVGALFVCLFLPVRKREMVDVPLRQFHCSLCSSRNRVRINLVFTCLRFQSNNKIYQLNSDFSIFRPSGLTINADAVTESSATTDIVFNIKKFT